MHLVSNDLAFDVVLEVPESLEPALEEFPELVGECVVEEVVHTHAGTRGFASVCWTYALLCGTDALWT